MKMSAPSHQRRSLAIIQVLAALAQNDLADYHKTYFRGLSEAPRLTTAKRLTARVKALVRSQTTHFRL
jgi:hypothetical protein